MKLTAFGAAAALLLLTACSETTELPTPQPTEPVDPNTPFATLDETLFSCDFQNRRTAEGLFSVYNLGTGEPTTAMRRIGFTVSKPWLLWLMDDYTSTNYWAGATSDFTDGAAANAWLVTQPIDIPNEQCVLSWKSESLSSDKPDQLTVYVSTTGGDPQTDFVAPALEPVYQAVEPAGDTDRMDGEWNEHSVSLSAYAGQRVWVAFVNHTQGGSIVGLDDVAVVYKSTYSLTGSTPQFTTEATTTVKGTLAARDYTIRSFTVHYTAADSVVHSRTYDNVNLQPGQGCDFAFDEALALTQGRFTPYKVWASVTTADGAEMEALGYTDSVASVAFVPQHRVVLEEGTGTWCGWCPQGILAIEHLQEVYPETFLAIAVHNDSSQDPFVVDAYDRGLGFAAFPQGLVNRAVTCYPMYTDGQGHYSTEGSGTFHEAVTNALKEQPLMEVRATAATLSGRTLNVTGMARWAVGENRPCNVAYVLTENNVTATRAIQSNYLAEYTLEAFGRFGAGGSMGQSYIRNMAFQEVARAILPSFTGDDSLLPDAPQAGTEYPLNATFTLSSDLTYNEAANCELTILLIDRATGAIVNADRVAVN